MTKPPSNSVVLHNQGTAAVSDEGGLKQGISKAYLFCKGLVSGKDDIAAAVPVDPEEDKKLSQLESREKVDTKKSVKKYVIDKTLQVNKLIEKAMSRKIGLVLLAGVATNVYQVITSGMVKTDPGKTLLILNQIAVLMLLYGIVMSNRAGGHIAMAIGVAFVVVANLGILGIYF